MKAVIALLLTILASLVVRTATKSLHPTGVSEEAAAAIVVINAVLTATTTEDLSVILMMEKNSAYGDMTRLRTPWGISVFEVEHDETNPNMRESAQLSKVIAQARWMRLMSWSVTVVVVSDDPAFLATFAEWSLKGRLLVWSTRLLVLTRLPLHHLQELRKTLAMTNSMLLKLIRSPTLRCNVYVEQPFGPENADPLVVGAWSPEKGIMSTSLASFFPQKFEKLANGPVIKVTHVAYPSTKRIVVDDPEAPGGKRVVLLDPEIRLFEIIGSDMNFTFEINSPADQAWGVPMANGSYTGMMGMMQRREVNISLSLLHVILPRSRVVDYTYPLTVWYSRIVVRRGIPLVDPWGFLFPFRSLVWLALFISLVVVMAVMAALPHVHADIGMTPTNLFATTFNCVRVFLQEDMSSVRKWWWWERVMLGVWMMMMLVMSQSYTGNLMSLLAVRYIPKPIQLLEDLLHQPVVAVTPAGTTQATSFLDAEDGILKQVGDLRHVGRFQPVYLSEMNTYLDQHVRRGSHVIILLDSRTPVMLAQDFTEKGRCDFYQAQEKILPMMASFATPKDSPLFPALNKRVMKIVETGIYQYWLRLYTPNYTACLNPPNKVAVQTTLALVNLWGSLVAGVAGVVVSLLVFFLEVLCFKASH